MSHNTEQKTNNTRWLAGPTGYFSPEGRGV